jgi:hypothetical protein
LQEIDPWKAWGFQLERLSPPESCGIGFKHELDLITDSAEFVEDFLLGSRGVGRIIKAPVKAVKLSGEHRAGLIGVAADGDHGINGTVQELIHVFGVMSRDVDSDFLEDFDGLWMDIAGGFGAGAGHLDEVACGRSEDAFGEMATAGVAGAKDEDERFHGKKSKGDGVKFLERENVQEGG